ncbi:MAG: elongation factor P [Candidatus Hydrogenedentota bacterium]|nr:MAG: elongation factor P [Candidatus Hydrogenedentota bacterium]
MITMNEIKKGLCLRVDGRLVRVVDFQHVKPGKGAAFVRTKIKEIESGRVLEKTFRDSDRIEEIQLEGRQMQLLYSDDAGYHFMDESTYEQITLSADDLGDAVSYLKENDVIRVDFYENRAVGIDLPAAVELTVSKTEPAVRGNTATAATKPATLETGLTVQVPLFIAEGEKVKVDTRTGEFLGRA